MQPCIQISVAVTSKLNLEAHQNKSEQSDITITIKAVSVKKWQIRPKGKLKTLMKTHLICQEF